MLQYIHLPYIYYPGKVKISDIKHRNKSVFVNFKVTGVTLGGMVGRCFVLLLSSSCKDPPVITSGVLVGVCSKKVFKQKISSSSFTMCGDLSQWSHILLLFYILVSCCY